jgi:hypothetical protein
MASVVLKLINNPRPETPPGRLVRGGARGGWKGGAGGGWKGGGGGEVGRGLGGGGQASRD